MQQSETDFVLEAIKRAAHKARTSFVPTKKRKIMDENDYSSPTKKVAAGASISVPIGYWADSDALLSIDKHAVHGVSHEDGRFGVKVMNHTRDGRPQHGNYPDAPRKMWIAFQKCALNFDLRHLDYLGVKEYCRLRRISLLNGETEDQRPAAEAEAISMAETFVSDTFAAENMGVPKSSAADSKRDAVHGLKREKKPDMGFNRQDTTPSPRTTYENGTKRTLPSSPASYAGFQKDASRPDITPLSREGHTQFEVPRESEFKENLAGTESEKDDGDDTKQVRLLIYILYQQLLIKLIIQGKRSQSNTRRSAEPTPKNPCSSDNGLDEEEEKLVDCNGVSYERKKSGPLSGKLVGDKREVFSINGQDYVEYRVLMKVVFQSCGKTETGIRDRHAHFFARSRGFDKGQTIDQSHTLKWMSSYGIICMHEIELTRSCAVFEYLLEIAVHEG